MNWRLLLALPLVGLILAWRIIASSAATITVLPSQSVQAAIDAAASGDTVHVQGVHTERVVIARALVLEGEAGAMLDGGCAGWAGVEVGANGVTVRNLTVRNTPGPSIYLNGQDGARPANVTIEGNALLNFDCDQSRDHVYEAGVSSYYGGGGLRIVNNTITGPYSPSTNCGSGECADGIWVKSNESNPSGGGHYIGSNRISNVWDGIGGEEEGSSRGAYDRNSTIERNVIGPCHDDGIQMDGGNQNNVVQDNEVYGCGSGVSFNPVNTGPLTIRRNYIHDLVSGDWFGGDSYCFKVGGGGGGTTTLDSNRCIVPSGGTDGIHQTNDGLTPLSSSGNCYITSRYVFEIGGPVSGLAFDGDTIYTTDATGRFVKWQGAQVGFAAFNALPQVGTEVLSQTCPSNSTPTPASQTPTATPTSTVTSTATPTATLTSTPSPTSSPTSTPTLVAVSPTSTPTALDLRCRLQDRQGGSWVYVVGEWVQQANGRWACEVLNQARPY